MTIRVLGLLFLSIFTFSCGGGGGSYLNERGYDREDSSILSWNEEGHGKVIITFLRPSKDTTNYFVEKEDEFDEFAFTNCNSTGPYGPTIEQFNNFYSKEVYISHASKLNQNKPIINYLDKRKRRYIKNFINNDEFNIIEHSSFIDRHGKDYQ